MEARAAVPNATAGPSLPSVLPKPRSTAGLILKHVIQTCLVCLSLFRAQQCLLTMSGQTNSRENTNWTQTENERGRECGRKRGEMLKT